MDLHRSSARTGGRQGTRKDSEALWDWNLESGRIHFSPRWIALVGYDDHELGTTPEEWIQRIHPDDSARVMGEIESARTGDSTAFTVRHRLRHKDGTYRWMSCQGVVVRNEAGQAIRLTGSNADVTVEMVTDPMTGLPNRLLLVDRVTHSIERARRYKGFHFAVLVIDLGRPAGPRRAGKGTSDPVLTAVARRLETSLRVAETMPSLRHNDLVARMDGDYFAILLDGLKEITHAKIVAERVLSEILSPFVLGAREIRLTASIGIAVSPTGYTKAEDVLHDAETALHRAQVLGGSHCEVFDTAILKSEQAELRLEGDFEAALQRRDFELVYQPIVALASNELLGFEALVRWRHPVLGLIAPADFLPVAERTGFIVPLGNWILREACLRLNDWQSGLPRSRDLSVSVNLSGIQFTHPTLVDEIAEALRFAGLEPRRLVLELTEGVAMANPTAVMTMLMRLRAMGVRISVDDFGTGYSSLAYLRQFPIDTLKIDRSFVRGMITNKDTAEIVASLIGMSRQLGLQVVAEGIEHDDQLAHLRTLTCDAGQGELFAKPLDVEHAAALVKTGLAPRPQRRRVTAGHRMAFAMAALALLLSAGLVVALNALRPEPELSRAPMPDVKLLVEQHAGNESSEPLPVPVPARPSSAPALSSAPATPVLSAMSASPVPTDPPGLPPMTSLEVVHQHRLGSCRGRLDVTRDGLAFVPADDGDDDAFTLMFAEFLHALSDDTLIVKSATRTYRFKTAASGGKNVVRLRDLADRIARSRR